MDEVGAHLKFAEENWNINYVETRSVIVRGRQHTRPRTLGAERLPRNVNFKAELITCNYKTYFYFMDILIFNGKF
jgi:hypothetical protein